MSDNFKYTSDKFNKKFVNRLLGVFVTILILWLLFIWLAERIIYSKPITREDWGQFGDFFNVLNTLFSGLAFGAIVVTLFISRADFRASLIEISTAAKAQKVIAEEARRGRVEKYAQIYQFFNSQDMYISRNNMWKVAIGSWFKDEKVRSRLNWYSSYCIDNPDKVSDQDIKECSFIFDFYSYLYQIYKEDHEQLIVNMKRYYYPAWRGFLLSFIAVSTRSFRDFSENDGEANIHLDSRFEDILQIDRICFKNKFNPFRNPYYKRIMCNIKLNEIDIECIFFPDIKERVLIDQQSRKSA